MALGVVIGDGDVRLHGVRVHHGKVKFAFGDVRGRSEGRVHVSPLDVHGLANISRRAREIVEAAEGAAGKIRVVDARSSFGASAVSTSRIASSSSYSTAIFPSASCAANSSSAITAATGSPTKRTLPIAIRG